MAPDPTPSEGGRPAGSAFSVFIVFLQLGLTSFGGPIAHLNVSNAAAVALYECARQRAAKTEGGKKP